MIKDKFTFSKKSWHVRLMRYIWGWDHWNFRNMCPYFWLTLFNVIILLPTFVLVKYIIVEWGCGLYDTIGDMMTAMSDRYKEKCKAEQQAYKEKMRLRFERAVNNEDNLLETYYRSNYLDKKNPESRRMDDKDRSLISDFFYNLWRDNGTKAREIEKRFSDDVSKWRHEWEQKESAKREKEQKQKAQVQIRIGQLTVMFKKFFTVLAYLLVGYVFYWIYRLGVFLWELSQRYYIRWDLIWYWGIRVFLGILVVCAFISVIVGLYKLINYLWCTYGEYCESCKKRLKYLLYIFVPVILVVFVVLFPFINLYRPLFKGEGDPRPGPILWVVITMWEGLVVLWQVIVAVKDNNCPSIEWKE